MSVKGDSPARNQPQGSASQAGTPVLTPPAKTEYGNYPGTCQEGKKSYDPVSCSQWRATIAAEKAVEAAHNSNLIGAGSAILSLAALIALFLSILQTKKALKHGQRANEILDDTSRKELRAYVIPRDQELIKFAPGQRPTFVFKLYNSGQTPAHDVRCITLMWRTDADVDEYRCFFRTEPPGAKLSRDVIGPNDFKLHMNPSSNPFPLNEAGLIINGQIKLIYAGIISYRDIFGKRHLSTFRQFLEHDGDAARTAFDLTSCATGNYSN